MKLSDGIIPFTPEWVVSRAGKLTSSCIHKIFVSGRSKDQLIGQGGMTYIDQKIGEILTGIMADDVPETNDVLRGQSLEPWIIERYIEITGRNVHDSLLFNYNSVASGTTDGQLTFGDDPYADIEAILEAKAPRAAKHIKILAVDAPIELEKIDPQYHNQPQANILFTDAKYCDFVSGNEDIKHYDLQIRIIRLYPDLSWRKDFVELVDWISDYMVEKLEKIMLAPSRNSIFRTEKGEDAIEKLHNAIELIKEKVS